MAEFPLYIYVRRTERYPYRAARTTTQPRNAKPGEVRLRLDIDLPAELFSPTELRATVKVDAKNVVGPVIPAEVTSEIERALSKRLGLTIRVSAGRKHK